MFRSGLMVWLWILWNPILYGQEPTRDLTDFSYRIKFDGQTFSGKGFEKIVNRSKEATYTLLGEDHGLVEIPKLTNELISEIQPNGYDVYVGELGPLSARLLQDKLKGSVVRNWLSNYPWSIPFVGWEEELVLLEKMSSQGVEILGIDQEFILSPVIHFQRLMELSTSSNQKEFIDKLLKKENEARRELIGNANYLDLFMVSALRSDFERLKELFTGKDQQSIVYELERSFKTYQLMMNGKANESNDMRTEIMRSNFDSIAALHSSSKILIKLGAMHCFRKNSPSQAFEIGEYLAGLEPKRSDTFHLLVLGSNGTYNNYTPQSGFRESTKTSNYDIRKRFPMDLGIFLDFIDEDSWWYFDLEPMRKSTLFSEETKKIVNAYDGLLIIPKVNASKSLY